MLQDLEQAKDVVPLVVLSYTGLRTQLVHTFRARVVDVAPDSLIIEATGTEEKIDGLLGVLRPFGVLEMVRTGRVAMARGEQSVATEPTGEATTPAPDDNVSYPV